jgi:cystathionine beta-lyase/cystathionine gamma-synthase
MKGIKGISDIKGQVSFTPPDAVDGSVRRRIVYSGVGKKTGEIQEALLAAFSAGAYGFVMSSQYNSRPRATEVMVEGDKHVLVRKREVYNDLVVLEEEGMALISGLTK